MKFSTSLVKFGSVGDLALELKKALTAIAAGWNVEHHPDGSHKATMTLPDNVALKDQANAFTKPFTKGAHSLSVQTDLPLISWVETGQPADARLFRIYEAAGFLHLAATNDAETVNTGEVSISRAGNLQVTGSATILGTIGERGRSVPIGEWTDFTPTLTASAGTVSVSSVLGCRYTLVGKTLTVTFYLGITLSATPANLIFTLPGGAVAATITANALLDGTGTALMFQTINGSATANLYRNAAGSGTWPTGAQTIAGTVTVPIQ